MPGLTFSNELISRDEALHTNLRFFSTVKLANKLEKSPVTQIVTESVEIEKEFICEALPCRLIGIDSKMMSQYIEFVADRLFGAVGL